MAYYSKLGVGRRGRPRPILPIVLNEDLKCISSQLIELKACANLEALQTNCKAQKRQEWKKYDRMDH